ncbi:PhzF family phenazine biosynthesis protein [Spelaeicoccus albus]|uniref:PhzF family phenazine biosynthesis protein n=1 Tax=Spelaeicoccus albus TaxID=1280376 RepID=A0A7Z0IHV7_9MICO|nr:PhzF family phenazine biosynthesis protein [Spelaeicoccus albus]NYI67896.1 PhzF family phenazine biosynthesis protein [Spelaeicoccus albus]
MEIPLHQIDAFATKPFTGNPAAVMPLGEWPNDAVLAGLAEENNLSETAFYTAALPADTPDRPEGGMPQYHLRWFTPVTEVDLCGHATLAAAAQLFEDEHPNLDEIAFYGRSGWLTVRRTGPRTLELDFPAEFPEPTAPDDEISRALGIRPVSTHAATDLLYVVDDAQAVRALDPDFTALRRMDARGVMVTAEGPTDGPDFVSRWFGGKAGVAEDPVTGSAHSQLAPFWAARLGKTALRAEQLSARGGVVDCTVEGDRVRLAGSYVRYLDGFVTLET